jgi:hypothetical protein
MLTLDQSGQSMEVLDANHRRVEQANPMMAIVEGFAQWHGHQEFVSWPL